MPSQRGGRSTSRKNVPLSPARTRQDLSLHQSPNTIRRSARITGAPSEADETVTRSLPSPTTPQSTESARELRRSKRQERRPDLSRIGEESENEEASGKETSPAIVLDEAGEEELSESDSITSSAYTSHSQREFQRLDREEMIDALPDLYRDSLALLSVFQAKDPNQLKALHANLTASDSQSSNALKRKRDHFEVSRARYGNDLYINIRTVLCKFANVENVEQVREGSWRPDAVLQQANLARLVSVLLAVVRKSEVAASFMDSLFNVFPQPFVSRFDATEPMDSQRGTKLIDETVSLLLEIQTQFFIQVLFGESTSANFDPDMVLSTLFFEERTGNLRTINQSEEVELPEAYHPRWEDRIKKIKSFFVKGGASPIDWEGLYDQYPWVDFLAQVASWAGQRAAELQATIHQQGGIESIQGLLQEGVFDLESEIQLGQQKEFRSPLSELATHVTKETVLAPASESPPHANKKSAVDAGAAKRVRQRLSAARERKAAAAQVAAIPQSGQGDRKSLQSPLQDEVIVLAMGDEDILPLTSREQEAIAATQQTAQILATITQQAAQSEKENIDTSRLGRPSFIDRQEGAQKITFDESQNDRAAIKDGKRKRVQEDEEDEEFETDSRQPVAKPGRRTNVTKTPPLQTLGSPGSVNTDPDQPLLDQQLTQEELARRSVSVHRTPLQHRPPPNARPPHLAPSTAPPSSSRPPGSQAPPSTVNAMARTFVKETRTRREPKPQIRRPFSEEETKRLIELIETYGTSWSTLLECDRKHPDGQLLEGRTQVNIKDKARNMKMDYLKAEVDMPANFFKIRLGNRLIQLLDNMGVPHTERL